MNRETKTSHFFLISLICIFTFTFLSGIFLSAYYIPTFTQAFASVERLSHQVPFGWLIRRIHGAGGNFLLILIFLNLLYLFFRGDYKIHPRSYWSKETLLLVMMVMANLTGILLPLSQSAFWGTITILSNLSSIPWIGSHFVDLLRGGKELGGTALIRFYSLHIGTSVFMALFLVSRYRLLFWERGPESPNPSKPESYLFTVMIMGLLLSAVTFVPGWFLDPLKEPANPVVNPERISPAWYFLFMEETLKFFTGTYPLWSGLALIFFLLLIFLLPFIDRRPEQNLLRRPMILGLGVALVVILIYFSLVGISNAHYGKNVVLPGRPLSSAEMRGAQVFAQKNCAYCHQVFGREGRREGPDLSGVKERQRSPEWLRRFILNARLYRPGTTMPRYEIPLDDLEALSSYLLSLQVQKGEFKTMDRTLFLDYGPFLNIRGDGK